MQMHLSEKVSLMHVHDNDYILNNFEADGVPVWITANNFSICLKATDVGMCIDVYAIDKEMDDPLASLQAWNDDCDR
jgi:uncharacterized protein (DUF779 family)